MDFLPLSSEELSQIQNAYAMMGYLEQLKSGFLARTSHELRSPVSSLMGLHQLILNDLCENPAEEREFIAQAYQATQKLIQIIDDIVQVSKLSYGSLSLEISPVAITQIWTNLEQLTHLQAANKGLKLYFLPPPNLEILVDASRLLQTLVMLVDTTIKLQSEGNISLQAQADKLPKSLLLTIQSNHALQLWQQEPISRVVTSPKTLAQVQDFSRNLETSPPMKLALALSLLSAMQCSLEIKAAGEQSTEIICTIPLADR